MHRKARSFKDMVVIGRNQQKNRWDYRKIYKIFLDSTICLLILSSLSLPCSGVVYALRPHQGRISLR